MTVLADGTFVPRLMIVQGKPVVRRGRKARDLARDRPAADRATATLRMKGIDRESQTGSLYLGRDGPGFAGAERRCRDAVGLVVRTTSKAAVVIEGGHRWEDQPAF